MNNSALRLAKTAVVVRLLRFIMPGEKTAKKNFPRFIPPNPLISLDSDERIQGNPS
jgi:hypothetical protein